MLLFEPLKLSIIFTPIFYIIRPNFPVLLPSAYSSSKTAVKFCPISCFAAMMLKLLCFEPKVMLFLPCKQQGAGAELWCCRKRCLFFSYSHASQPHTCATGIWQGEVFPRHLVEHSTYYVPYMVIAIPPYSHFCYQYTFEKFLGFPGAN